MDVFDKISVFTLTNQSATRDNILNIQLPEVTPHDTVIVLIAGHGVYDDNELPVYYYLCHDTDINNLSETAVPFEYFETQLAMLKSRLTFRAIAARL